MANLVRNNRALDTLVDFRRDFDSLFSSLFADATGSGRQMATNDAGLIVALPPIEAWVDPGENKYHLSIAVPGVDSKDIQLNLQGNALTVVGERERAEEKKDANYLQREFTEERFERTITLPESVDTQQLTAQHRNGVLEITAPLRAEALPKRIEIKSLPAAGDNPEQGAKSNVKSASAS
jgi:HSP20 family protein